MILRDKVQAISTTSVDVIATMPAAYGTRAVGLEDSGRAYRMVEQLYVITPPGFPWSVNLHRVLYRGDVYNVVAVNWRRRNGRDHHCTVDLERMGAPL